MADENMPEEQKTEETPNEAPIEEKEATAEVAEEKPAEQPAEEPKEEPQEEKEEVKEEAPAEEVSEEEAPAEEEPKEEEVVEVEAEPEVEEVEGDFVMAGVALKPGLTIRIHQRINEGEKSRVQVFEGMVLKLRGDSPETKTATVRKIASGVGVEKIFPLNMPSIEKVEVVKEAKVRRSKLYYLRDYKKKLKETLHQ